MKFGRASLLRRSRGRRPQAGRTGPCLRADAGRIYIEKINGPFLFELKGTPAAYKAGLDRATIEAWTMEGSMQVWILMRNVWDGRVGNSDVVDEVFSSEIAAERARREKENAAKDQMNADRYSVEGPFEVGG